MKNKITILLCLLCFTATAQQSYIITNAGAGDYGSSTTPLTLDNIQKLGGDSDYNGSTSVILTGNSFERAALTGDVTAAQNSNTTTIADNAVTDAKINDVSWGKITGAPDFLTTETDPTVPAYVKSITTGNISDWHTAYGWGNHATAGYLGLFNNISGQNLSIINSNYILLSGQGSNSVSSNALNISFNTTDPSAVARLRTSNLTTGRNYEFPNESGEFALKSNIPAQVNLTAGSNVTITGSYPNLTINSSGGSGDNFANADLTFTGDRVHNMANKSMTWGNSGGFVVLSPSLNGFGLNDNGNFAIYNNGSANYAQFQSGFLTGPQTYVLPNKSGTVAMLDDIVAGGANIGNTDLTLSGNRTLNGSGYTLNLGANGNELLSLITRANGNATILGSSGLTLTKTTPISGSVRLAWDNIEPNSQPQEQQLQDYNGELEVLQTDTPALDANFLPATLVYGTQKYGKIKIDPFTTPLNGSEIFIFYPQPFKNGSAVVLQSNSGLYHKVYMTTGGDDTLKNGFSILLDFPPGEYVQGDDIYYIVNGH